MLSSTVRKFIQSILPRRNSRSVPVRKRLSCEMLEDRRVLAPGDGAAIVDPETDPLYANNGNVPECDEAVCDCLSEGNRIPISSECPSTNVRIKDGAIQLNSDQSTYNNRAILIRS